MSLYNLLQKNDTDSFHSAAHTYIHMPHKKERVLMHNALSAGSDARIYHARPPAPRASPRTGKAQDLLLHVQFPPRLNKVVSIGSDLGTKNLLAYRWEPTALSVYGAL